MKTTVLHIPDMCCPTEQALVRKRLAGVAGVEGLAFDTLSRDLTVNHRLEDERKIVEAIVDVGLHPRLKSDSDGKAETDGDGRTKWIRLAVGGAAALLSEGVAYTTGDEHSVPVALLAAFAIVVAGIPTLRKGLASLRSFNLNINFLMSIAIAGALATGHWGEAAMVTVLFALAEEIEKLSMEKARNAVKGLLESTPETATVRAADGRWHSVPSSNVVQGQLVRVKPGERLPLDGIVRMGQSSVNQAPITGESVPVEKSAGDVVFAGTVNERGTFDFEVTGVRGNTTLDRIIRLVQEAQSQKAPTERFIDQFARFYTPAVCILALGIAIVPPAFMGAPVAEWVYRALVLLVISCPCALVISTPVTIVCGLAHASRRGILVKGGSYLETARNLRLVALDKTGTLTEGKPRVTDVVPFQELCEDDVLEIAASVDAHSEHPIASAIVHGLSFRGGTARPVTGFESLTGRGVKADLDGKTFFLGNHRLMSELGLLSADVEQHLGILESQGKTAVALADDAGILGLIAVSDALRETSVEAVRQLHRLGVRTAMLTGDNRTTGKAIAEAAGIDDCRSELMPEEKLSAIEDLHREFGEVGMVGDGINDAPALARATIGFAMGKAGTDTALETADVALMHDDLRAIPEFIGLSRRTRQILVQNIVFAVGIKALFLALAFMGQATLWMAVFADMGASLLVVFNGLRLLSDVREGRGRFQGYFSTGRFLERQSRKEPA